MSARQRAGVTRHAWLTLCRLSVTAARPLLSAKPAAAETQGNCESAQVPGRAAMPDGLTTADTGVIEAVGVADQSPEWSDSSR